MPAKKTKKAKSGRRVKTLADVMKWAFEGEKRGVCPNLKKLLKHTDPDKIRGIVDVELGNLPPDEREELINLLTKKEVVPRAGAMGDEWKGDARIYSRQVLNYMRDLILRKSTVPPPWRA